MTSSTHTLNFTAYLRNRQGTYAAVPVTIPAGSNWLPDLDQVGPVVLTGVHHGYRATISDLYECGSAMIREGQRVVGLAQGIERGTTAGPADWLELGADSYRSAA